MSDSADTLSSRDTDDGQLQNAFVRYRAELLGTLFYLMGNLEDAQDAMQEAFLKCWRHRDELGQINNLKAWIFRIVLNTGRDMRQTAWRRKREGLPDDDALVDQRQEDPQARAEHHERLDRIQTVVLSMRQEDREVFLLRQNGQLKYEEIAEAVGIPLGTVKTRMRMALTHLRENLGEDV